MSKKQCNKRGLFIATVILVAAAVLFFVIRGKDSHLPASAEFTQEEIKLIDSILNEETENREDTFEYRIKANAGDLGRVEPIDTNIVNILLLGTDNKGTLYNGRSDTMIICSVNKKSGHVKLTSIVRDLWVDIPKTNTQNRINTANAFGGPYLAMMAVNETFGLDITKYCAVNMTCFEEIVDILGGVDLEITGAEAGEINKIVTDEYTRGGNVHLSGAQALMYCRIRSLDNNFGRNNRQRKFLAAVASQLAQKKDIGSLIRIAGVCFRYVSTNMGLNEIISLAKAVLPNTGEMEMYSCPANGQFRYETIRGMSVVTADTDTISAAVKSFIYD